MTNLIKRLEKQHRNTCRRWKKGMNYNTPEREAIKFIKAYQKVTNITSHDQACKIISGNRKLIHELRNKNHGLYKELSDMQKDKTMLIFMLLISWLVFGAILCSILCKPL